METPGSRNAGTTQGPPAPSPPCGRYRMWGEGLQCLWGWQPSSESWFETHPRLLPPLLVQPPADLPGKAMDGVPQEFRSLAARGGGPDGVLVLATGMLRKFQVLSQHMEDSISPPLSVSLAKRLKKPSIRLYVGGPSGHGDSCCHEGPPDAGAGADTSHRRGVGRTGPCPCTRRTREAGRPHAVPRQWVSARGGSGARSSTSKHPHLRQHRVTRL